MSGGMSQPLDVDGTIFVTPSLAILNMVCSRLVILGCSLFSLWLNSYYFLSSIILSTLKSNAIKLF
jgi:hypothetical protein